MKTNTESIALLSCQPMEIQLKAASEWKKRRKEIKEEWMSLIGEWPPVITNQKFEIINTLKREDFYQYRVRFCWTPNEQTEGYLLIPDKRGKKPQSFLYSTNPKQPSDQVGNPTGTLLIN